MNVNLTRLSRPRMGRDEQCHQNSGEPLDDHQPREQLIGLAKDFLPMSLKDASACAERFLLARSLDSI